MELKNAATICLISFFAATLVLLIARALDMHTAARLEPHLTRIAEELEALRKSGGTAAAAPAGRPDAPLVDDGLIVYYLHSKRRCVTCQAVESQTRDVVQSDFAAELVAGTVAWKVLNYEEPSGAGLAEKFGVASFAVVLAKMQGGEIAQWKRLDRAGALVGDKSRFASYVRDEIHQMLRLANPQPTAASSDKPEAKEAAPATADRAVPVPADLPIPE